jgi:hypothetical protein
MSYTVTARLRHSAAVYCLVTTTAPHQLLITATPEAITVWTHGSSIGWQMLALQDINPEQTPTCLSLAPASNKRRHSHSLLVGCWDGTFFFYFFFQPQSLVLSKTKSSLSLAPFCNCCSDTQLPVCCSSVAAVAATLSCLSAAALLQLLQRHSAADTQLAVAATLTTDTATEAATEQRHSHSHFHGRRETKLLVYEARV